MQGMRRMTARQQAKEIEKESINILFNGFFETTILTSDFPENGVH